MIIRWSVLFTILLFSTTASFSQTTFGDSLFSFNAGQLTPTPDRTLYGITFAEGHFWVTGFNAPIYDHRLYKISADGSTLLNSTSLGSGYHAYFDLTYDGEFLYATDRNAIVQIDPATSTLTGESIPVDFGYLLVQGVAYDPENDHFWVIPQRNGQLQIIHEIDRDGNILNTFSNKTSDYTTSLTWDTLSPGGPYLWTFSREEIGFDSRGVMRQFSPAIGEFTGIEIDMTNRSPYVADTPLGIAMTATLDTATVAMVALQAGAIQVVDGLDWIVVYDADLRDQQVLGPSISVTPGAIQIQMFYGDSLDVPVVIENSGEIILSWEAYVENIDSSNSPQNLGDSLFSMNLIDIIGNEDVRLYSMTYAREHYWVSGRILPDQKRLFKIDNDGNLIAAYPTPSVSSLGWRAITTDGDYIYGTDTYSIGIWSIDSTQSVGNILTGSISADAFAYDPGAKRFYLSNSNGAIEVLDRQGNQVSFLVTDYEIEGLAWDNFSPDGPFLWAWVNDDNPAGANSKAVRLDGETGVYTGVSFSGENLGTIQNFPEAATLAADLVDGKLIFLGLQNDDEYPANASFLVAYDLGVTPPPLWIHLIHPSDRATATQSRDTLLVRFHAMMSDTTTAAIIKINSNDLNQPLVEIPVTTEMLETSVTAIDERADLAPEGFYLGQNYPNPFNPSTTIEYSLAQTSEVLLVIYDLLGREVTRIDNGRQSAGAYRQTLNAVALPSGSYFYTLKAAGRVVATRKMILLR